MLGTLIVGSAVRFAAAGFARVTGALVDLTALSKLNEKKEEVELMTVPLACTAREFAEITSAPPFQRALLQAEALFKHGALVECGECGAVVAAEHAP